MDAGCSGCEGRAAIHRERVEVGVRSGSACNRSLLQFRLASKELDVRMIQETVVVAAGRAGQRGVRYSVQQRAAGAHGNKKRDVEIAQYNEGNEGRRADGGGPGEHTEALPRSAGGAAVNAAAAVGYITHPPLLGLRAPIDTSSVSRPPCSPPVVASFAVRPASHSLTNEWTLGGRRWVPSASSSKRILPSARFCYNCLHSDAD
ncbi:hypothetical protein CC78DRAFT_585359 [Lojkania enalia]|uniref:Uncharacterized protein n=1 Tax=Lojkania enalia TaxID=147567 RepID=A0A9P4K4G3_9PLEO|nr:hypothetical protein CC78DRAFT_585359 [Didymosphaeria enalia]